MNGDLMSTVLLRDRKIYVKKEFLSAVYGVGMPAVNNWRWINEAKLTGEMLERSNAYDFEHVKLLHRSNISEKQSERSKKKVSGTSTSPTITASMIESMGEDIVDEYKGIPEHLLPKAELERRNEAEKLYKAQLNNKILMSEYIAIDDIDKDMATLATMFMSMLINFEKSAPVVLENRPKEDITKLIEESHSEMLEKLDSLINKEFSGDDTLYDVIKLVSDQLEKGRSPEEIKKCLVV